LEDADRRRLGVIRKTLNAGVSASEDIDLGKLAARMAEVLVTPEAIDGKARYVSLSKVDEPGVRYSSIPDEIGNCQLTGIPPGDYRLEAQLVDGQLSVLADVLRLTAGERRTVNSVISATPAQR
jgi:hypothetical protein